MKAFPGPGNVAAWGLCSQSHLRWIRSREWRFKLENVSMVSREKHTVTGQTVALLLRNLWDHPSPHILAWRRLSKWLLIVCSGLGMGVGGGGCISFSGSLGSAIHLLGPHLWEPQCSYLIVCGLMADTTNGYRRVRVCCDFKREKGPPSALKRGQHGDDSLV